MIRINGGRRIVTGLVVAATVLWAGLVWAQPQTEQVITDLETKAAAVQSYRADLTMTMEMMGQKMVARGQFLFKKPNKSRIETVMQLGAMKMQQVIVSDGATAWTHQPMMNMVAKIDLAKVAAATGEGPSAQKAGDISKPFEMLRREGASLVRTDQIGAKKAFVFEGAPAVSQTQAMPFAPAKIEVWIAAEDGLVRKVTMFNQEGKEMMSQSYSNIELNVELPDDQFIFTPPEGTQVMDMTEATINMIKQMKKPAD